MKTSFTLGKVLGIPINIHITFLLIVPLFVYVFAVSELSFFWFKLGFGGMKDIALRLLFAFLATILLFFCVLLHELGHSYVALKYGAKIKFITLFIFGGVASIEKIPREPEKESSIALIGPLTSFGLGFGFSSVFFALRAFDSSGALTNISTLFSLLGFYNILLACFNMLPAFPMDGGRLLRSFLATRMGYIKATSKAVAVGKGFAVVMGIFGAFTFNALLILIAFIVYVAAGEEERATIVTITLERVKVEDVMTPEVISVPPTLSVAQFVDFMLKTKHMGYPVIDEVMGRLEGVVTLSDVRKVPIEQRASVSVREIMSKNIISVAPDSGAVDALKLMLERRIGRLLVLDFGRLVGIVSRTDLMKAIQILR